MRGVFEDAGLPVSVLSLDAALRAPTAETFHAAVAAATRDLPWDQIDVVIANTMVSFWAVHAARRAHKPVMIYVHESAPIRRFFAPILAPALFPEVESAFRNADRVVFTADASRVVFDYLGGGGNFALLPSWVDVARVDEFARTHDSAELRRKHGLDPDATLVINIGSLCERKGQHIFIKAADLLTPELRQTFPDRKIQFVMVGARAGVYLDMLKEEVAHLGLGESVLFLPETGEIFDFYQVADVFVCTSFEESFPRVLLEASAFRRPIVTTNVNGIAEMLSEKDAWLTPPGDRYRLAEAIKRALKALFRGDRTRPESARATVARKYDQTRSFALHRAIALEASRNSVGSRSS